jgi:predicted ATPase
VWYVNLAPITDSDLVPITAARALGLPDQPGRSTMDTLLRFVRDRQLLMVLDNCEHLLYASAELVVVLAGASAGIDVAGDQSRTHRGSGRGDVAGAVAVDSR